MAEPYKRFDENLTDPNVFAPPEPLSNPVVQRQIIQEMPPAPTQSVQNGGKVMKVLTILVFIKLILGILIIILGSTCMGILLSDIPGHYRVGCYAGSGMWVGVLAVVSAAIGIAATRKSNNRCLLIGYFVLCVVSTVLCVELIVVSSIHANEARERLRYYNYDNGHYYYRYKDVTQAGLGINITLALLAGIHFVCAVIASSLICTIWNQTGCCNVAQQQQAPAVIFIQTQPGVTADQPQQAVIIQQGQTQTLPIFVPQQPINTTA